MDKQQKLELQYLLFKVYLGYSWFRVTTQGLICKTNDTGKQIVDEEVGLGGPPPKNLE